jgi:hypothetical protein
MGEVRGKVIFDTSQAKAAVDDLTNKVTSASKQAAKSWNETISERFAEGVKAGTMPLSTYRSALKVGIIDKDNQVRLFGNAAGSAQLNESPLGRWGFDVVKQGNPLLNSGVPRINLGGQDEIQGAKMAARMAVLSTERAARDAEWERGRSLRVASEAAQAKLHPEETVEAYSARVKGTPLDQMAGDDVRRALAEGMVDAKGNFKGIGDEGQKSAEQISRAYITEQRKIGVAATRMGRDFLIVGAAMGAIVGGAVKSYATLEVSLTRLSQAMKSTGEYSKSTLAGFKDQAVGLMQLSGISVAATLQDISYAKSLKMTNEQITQLLPRMADISITLGIDMQTAFKAASLSLNGITTQMRRLGFYVEAGKDGLVSVNDILEATSGAAGAAAAKGESLAGSWDKVRQTAALVSASFGEQAAPAVKAFLDHVVDLINKFGDMDPASKKVVMSLGAVATAIVLVSGVTLLLIGRIAAAKSALMTLGLLNVATKILAGLASVPVIIAVGGAAMATMAAQANAHPTTMMRTEEKLFPEMYNRSPLRAGMGLSVGIQEAQDKAWLATHPENTYQQGGRGVVNRGVIDTRTPLPGSQYVPAWGGQAYTAPKLSEEAETGMQSLNNKILQLQVNGLEYSKAILAQEAEAMKQIAGMDSAKIAEYVKLQTAALTVAAQKDYKDSLYAATHTDLQTALYSERQRVDAMVKAGGATQGQADSLYKLTSAKITTDYEKKGSKTDQWKPISIEGTNVNSLMKYIGSIQGGKVKPQEVVLSLK